MPKINENKRKELKIKVLAEKIEKITGKKVLLEEVEKPYIGEYQGIKFQIEEQDGGLMVWLPDYPQFDFGVLRTFSLKAAILDIKSEIKKLIKSGKLNESKQLIKEDVKDYENAYNSLRGAIRAAGLGEFIKIARTSNYILIDLIDPKKSNALVAAVVPVLTKKGFSKKSDRKLKGNVYIQLVDEKNTKIFLQKTSQEGIKK